MNIAQPLLDGLSGGSSSPPESQYIGGDFRWAWNTTCLPFLAQNTMSSSPIASIVCAQRT